MVVPTPMAKRLAWIFGSVVAALIVSLLVHRFEAGVALDFPVDIGREVADVIDWAVDWLTVNMSWFFDAISDYLKVALGLLRDFLIWIPWPVMLVAVFLVGWKLAEFRIGLFSAVALALIGIVDLWESAMITVAIITVWLTPAIMVGMAKGIWTLVIDITVNLIRVALG